MSLFFNIHLLEQFSEGNPVVMLDMLKDWFDKKLLAKNSKDPFVPRNLRGSNFLLNPEKFLNDKVTDLYYKVQYLKLASLRNYYDYIEFGYKFLDITLYPDLNINAIRSNPLLKITNTKIYFKYEEI